MTFIEKLTKFLSIITLVILFNYTEIFINITTVHAQSELSTSIASNAIEGSTSLRECINKAVQILRDARIPLRGGGILLDERFFPNGTEGVVAGTFVEAYELAVQMCWDRFGPPSGPASSGALEPSHSGVGDGAGHGGVGSGSASTHEPALGVDILGYLVMGKLVGISLAGGWIGIGGAGVGATTTGTGSGAGGMATAAAEAGIKMAASVLAGIFATEGTSSGASDSSYSDDSGSSYSGYSTATGSTTSSTGSGSTGSGSAGTSVDCVGECETGADASASDGTSGTVVYVTENDDGSTTIGIDTDGDGDADVEYTGEAVPPDEDDCDGSSEDCSDGDDEDITAESETCRMDPWTCARIGYEQLEDIINSTTIIEEFLQYVNVLVISEGNEELVELNTIGYPIEDLSRYGYHGYKIWKLRQASSVQELRNQLELVMGLDSMVRVTIGVQGGYDRMLSYLLNEQNSTGDAINGWWPANRVSVMTIQNHTNNINMFHYNQFITLR